MSKSLRQHSADTFYQMSYYYGNAARIAGTYMATQAIVGSYKHAILKQPWRKAYAPAARTASFIARAHYNSFMGVMRTPLSTAKGSPTLGRALVRSSGVVAGGYVLGATTGTLVAGAIWGDDAAAKAWDLYAPGGASFIDEGIFGFVDNAITIISHYMEK